MKWMAVIALWISVLGCAEYGPFRGLEQSGAGADGGALEPDGGEPLPAIGEPQVVTAATEGPSHVAVDDDWVYWVAAGAGQVRRIASTGAGRVEKLDTLGPILDLELRDGMLYALYGGELDRTLARLDPASKERRVLVSKQANLDSFGVAGDSVFLGYPVDDSDEPYTGGLKQLDLKEGSVKVVTSGEHLTDGVTVTERYVYWGSWKEIRRAPLSDPSSYQILVSEQSIARMVRVLDGEVYWVDLADYQEGSSSIRRLSAAGAEVLASGLGDVTGMAVTDEGVYFSVLSGSELIGEIRRIDRRGGGITTVAEAQTLPRDLLSHGDYLYWAEQELPDGPAGAIWRMRFR